MAFETWLLNLSDSCWRTLNRKEQQRHCAVSLRQHGFLVEIFWHKSFPAKASQPAAQPRGPARSKACAINSNTINSTGLG